AHVCAPPGLHSRHRQGTAHCLYRLRRIPGWPDPRKHPLGFRPAQIRALLAALSSLASFERRRSDREDLRRPFAGDRLALRHLLPAARQEYLASTLRNGRNSVTEGNHPTVFLSVSPSLEDDP